MNDSVICSIRMCFVGCFQRNASHVHCLNNLPLKTPASYLGNSKRSVNFTSLNNTRKHSVTISAVFQTYQPLLEPSKWGCYGNCLFCGNPPLTSAGQWLSCCFTFCITCTINQSLYPSVQPFDHLSIYPSNASHSSFLASPPLNKTVYE